MTNAELNTELATLFPDNHANEITPEDLRDFCQEVVKRLPIVTEIDLVAGINEVPYPAGIIAPPIGVTIRQKLSSPARTIFLNLTDIYTEDASDTIKFFINSPDAYSDCIITLIPAP